MSTKHKFKTFLFLIGLVFFILILSSCGQAESKQKTLTIVVRSTGSKDYVKWMHKVIEGYTASNPNIEIKLQEIPSSGGEYFAKLALMLQNDPSVDVVFEDSFILKADVAAGYLAPLDVSNWPDWEQQYPKSARDAVSVDGKTYAVPITTDVRGLWYNTVLFKKAGLPADWNPKTWDDVLNAARAVKKVSGDDVVPFFLNSSKARGEATTMQSAQMLWYGTDDKMFDQGKWVVKSQGLLDTLGFFQSVYSEKLGAPLSLALSGEVINTIYQNYAPKDKVGITLDGMWVPQQWDNWSEWREHYKFTPMPTQNGQAPGFNSMSGGWTMALNAKSKNKELGWDFIKASNTKENVYELVKIGKNMVPRIDTTKIPEYQELGVLKKASEFMAFTHYRPVNEVYPSVSKELQIAIESVVTGDSSPEEAIELYAQSVERVVGEENTLSLLK